MCEPTSIADQRELWAAFVAGYKSTHQCSVVSARPSHDIFTFFFWGVWVPQQSRDVAQSIVPRRQGVDSRSIITEEIFHDCGSASATSE